MAVDLEAERRASHERRREQRLRARGNLLLAQRANAPPDQLRAIALREYPDHTDQWREEAVEAAMRIQEEEGVRYHGTKGGDVTPKTTTDGKALREWLKALFASVPKIRPPAAYKLAVAELGIQMKESSFQASYFYPVRKAVRRQAEKPRPTPTMTPKRPPSDPQVTPTVKAGSAGNGSQPSGPESESLPQDAESSEGPEYWSKTIEEAGQRVRIYERERSDFIWYDVRIDGERVRRSLETKDRELAEERARGIARGVAEGVRVSVPDRSFPSIDLHTQIGGFRAVQNDKGHWTIWISEVNDPALVEELLAVTQKHLIRRSA